MKLRKDLNSINGDLDVWECECGSFIPVKKGLPKPICEYCRRVDEGGKGTKPKEK